MCNKIIRVDEERCTKKQNSEGKEHDEVQNESMPLLGQIASDHQLELSDYSNTVRKWHHEQATKTKKDGVYQSKWKEYDLYERIIKPSNTLFLTNTGEEWQERQHQEVEWRARSDECSIKLFVFVGRDDFNDTVIVKTKFLYVQAVKSLGENCNHKVYKHDHVQKNKDQVEGLTEQGTHREVVIHLEVPHAQC